MFNNEPFEDYPRVVYGWKRIDGDGGEDKTEASESYAQAVEGFLRRTFHSLSFIPDISFDTRRVSEKAERKAFNAAMARYRTAGMVGQAGLLKEVYDGLRALRIVLGGVCQNNLFETVIPSRFLPELLTAAPVWFIEHKGEREEGNAAFEAPVIRYFCDLCTTDQFAYLFQIYNSRLRYFTEFFGRDIMPLPIVELIRQVRNLFDYMVIATPYHDIASKEWGKMRWVRNVDPVLFGLLKQVPELMFFLGRWSGRGLFLHIWDMMGDTSEHLDKGKELLTNLSDRSLFWYRTDTSVDFQNLVVGPRLRPIENYQMPKESYPWSKRERERWKMENHSLVKFANTVIQQFEEGHLFTWLRGDREVCDDR